MFRIYAKSLINGSFSQKKIITVPAKCISFFSRAGVDKLRLVNSRSCVSRLGVYHSQPNEMAASSRTLATLETLNFDNSALRSLPIDPCEGNHRRQVKGACFSKVTATPVKNPTLVAYSASAMALLDLPESEILRPEFVEYFAGNKLLPGSETAAHCYCGHQFGNFAGQLGDGAVVYLGEILNRNNERWEVQLKGAGKTPYSREGDGRKVLRSSIREFLCSEALFHLGIPTTRAGCCLTSESTVVRDIFYDGKPIMENCSLVTRIAPTFIRFGSFQICKGPDRTTGRDGPSAGRPDVLESLINYVVEFYYPDIWQQFKSDKTQMYAEFFKAVVMRTAALVADWQCVGFCHGVLNTDNLSILGLTIDYGPFGFMDRYDPNHICNTSDPSGRYAYSKQPSICKWNCMKLAEALQLLVPMEHLQPHIDKFDEEFERCYIAKMRKKFGLLNSENPDDKKLVESFLETMETTGADFTTTFRCLSNFPLPGLPSFDKLVSEAKATLREQCSSMEEIRSSLAPRMDPREVSMVMAIMRTSPQLAAALGKEFRQVLLEVERAQKLSKIQEMTEDEKRAEDSALWDAWIEKYMTRLTSDVADSTDLEDANVRRVHVMNSNNPTFVLRNYIAQNAISAAEKGDYSEVRNVLSLLQNPFSDTIKTAEVSEPSSTNSSADAQSQQSCAKPTHCSYFDKPPTWAAGLRVT